jgi:hypothetical protein
MLKARSLNGYICRLVVVLKEQFNLMSISRSTAELVLQLSMGNFSIGFSTSGAECS